MFIIFLIIDIWTLFAIPRSFIMFSIVSDDASYMPRALIERFMKVIVRYCERRSCIIIIIIIIIYLFTVGRQIVNIHKKLCTN